MTFGTVAGTVVDSSGATVSGATVKLTNLGTNETRTMQTGSGGTFAFPNSHCGSCIASRLRRQVSSTLLRMNVEVQVGVSTRVDATLQVGSVTDRLS